MALLTGAWINPWYTKAAFAKNTTFVSLASVTDWSQTTDPNYGFTKEKVSSFRSQTNAKVLISFGGSNTSANFWSSMAGDPETYSQKIVKFLNDVGADGIDYDYETEFSQQTSEGLKSIMEKVSKAGKGFIQTMSVLAGSYDYYKPIIDANVLNHIILMCYNGGMFVSGHASGGKDWKGWMDLWVGYMGQHKSKLVIGMCIQYNSSIQYYADQQLVNEGAAYCTAKGTGGMFFWWYSNDAPGASTIGPLIDSLS